ncbi:IS66 family insertion sequence element accessory protein TnpA [Pseudobutyrivibrio ruminis]|uniref:IS66 family insertion sequence element accessory protein TnpA n=1 Tax=Pseudobutyrivibrio ruminis TaxID=46206 RepID=UPI00040697A3
MRSKFTKQQKFDMVMECRNSGLSDYMWCKKHDIQSSTFYSWVKQLKRDGANVPDRTYAEDYHIDSKPDIVKLEIVDELPAEKPPVVQQLPSNNCASIVEMAKAHELNIYEYIKYILSQRPSKDWSDEQLETIAPWRRDVIEKCKR